MGVADSLSLRAWLADGLRFVVRPDYRALPLVWGRTAMLVLMVVLALDVALDALVSAVLGIWDESAGFLPAPIELDISFGEDLFTALLTAPLFAASLFVSPYLAMPVAAAGVALVFVGLLHWSRTRHYDTAVPAWFERHFGWLVWGSTVLFGLVHLGNYEPLTHLLGVLVVLPQTIGGLLLAYTRTRLGLRAAMVHHAACNAVFPASDYGWW